MPLRRSLLTVLCLAIFGTIPGVAQEKDPFREWDRQHDRSAKSRPAPGLEKSSEKAAVKSTVTYFSPEVEDSVNAESAEAQAPTAIPMRILIMALYMNARADKFLSVEILFYLRKFRSIYYSNFHTETPETPTAR